MGSADLWITFGEPTESTAAQHKPATPAREGIRCHGGRQSRSHHAQLIWHLRKAPERVGPLTAVNVAPGACTRLEGMRVTAYRSAVVVNGVVSGESFGADVLPRRRGMRAVLTATGLETPRRATPGRAPSVRKLFFGNINHHELACVNIVFTRLRESLQRNGRKST